MKPFYTFAIWNKPALGKGPHTTLMNKIKNNINNELQMELCAPHPGGDRGS
jgi:hypothetical protein